MEQSVSFQSRSHKANPEGTVTLRGQRLAYLVTSPRKIPNVDLTRLLMEGNLEAMSMLRGLRQVGVTCSALRG